MDRTIVREWMDFRSQVFGLKLQAEDHALHSSLTCSSKTSKILTIFPSSIVKPP